MPYFVSFWAVSGSLFLGLYLGLAVPLSGDAAALMAFKASADVTQQLDSLWTASRNVCEWEGIRECLNGRVSKLVMEHLQLNGVFAEDTLSNLDQLRVLSLKGNALTGPIPDLSALHDLKSLFLNQNNFTGSFPASIAGLHRLKIIVLADNSLQGEIPPAIAQLPRLYIFFVDNNRLSGRIPEFNQSSLKSFNISHNKFSGPIPETVALKLFNTSSFEGNPGLCGRIIHIPCNAHFAPSSGPAGPIFSPADNLRRLRSSEIAAIVAGSLVGFAFILGITILLIFKKRSQQKEHQPRHDPEKAEQRGEDKTEAHLDRCSLNSKNGSPRGLESQGNGTLIFCGGEAEIYTLEDMLKASAVILGKGTLGSTYKAVLENGLIMAVKRVKNSSEISRGELERHIELIDSVRHPHIVSLRSYFHAKDETLLVYDYYPNGSLFSLIHGTRSRQGNSKPKPKPLHWTSCLKIAEDVAQGVAHLHTRGLIHGSLKSFNVLIGSDFEACVADYGLTIFDSESDAEPSMESPHRAPECRPLCRLTSKADVYSYGVILIEILSGKTPPQAMMSNDQIAELPVWVKSVRLEDCDHDESGSGSASDGWEEKLSVLLNIAMACLSPSPGVRPTMNYVARVIQQARDSHASSHSSHHSPGRWSDTIHSLPRDHGSDHSFTERD